MKFNLLDAILLALLILSAYLGYRWGPLKKGITFLVTLAAVSAGFRMMHPLGGALAGLKLIPPGWCYVLVYALIVAGLLTVTLILYRRSGKKSTALKPGRIFASALGVLEAAVLISTILLMLKLLNFPGTGARSGSFLYRPMVNIAPWSFDAIRSVLPEGEKVQDDFSGDEHARP